MNEQNHPMELVFRRTIDSLPDGILLINGQRKVVYANDTFFKMWKIPDELASARDDRAMIGFILDQLYEPQQFIALVEKLYATQETSQDEILFKDGRVFSRRSVPFVDDDGTSFGRIWIFTDISAVRAAERDSLTGLFTRRKFSEEYGPRVLNAKEGNFWGVAMTDVDYFKRYNDTYGHPAGDVVLKSIGDVLLNHSRRANDAAYRIGGEEFLLLCSAKSEDDLTQLLEKVRRAVEDLAITHTGNPPGNIVTLSVGLALFNGPREPRDVFERADKALYQSKNSGRNRVTVVKV
jgi:diguanylate cyclase (GGDEF)-like protein